MPRLENAVPKYRKHRASGQAVVTLAGKDHYLGRYNTQSSRMLYKRLVGEWLFSGRPIDSTEYESLTITELVGRCWKHSQAFYRRTDGTKTDTADRMRPALRELRSLYGDLAAGGNDRAVRRLRRICDDRRQSASIESTAIRAGCGEQKRMIALILVHPVKGRNRILPATHSRQLDGVRKVFSSSSTSSRQQTLTGPPSSAALASTRQHSYHEIVRFTVG